MLLGYFMNVRSSGSCSVSDVSMAAQSDLIRVVALLLVFAYSQHKKLKTVTNTKSALVSKKVIFLSVALSVSTQATSYFACSTTKR